VTIVLTGINYQTAPLELRERLFLAGDVLDHALDALHGAVLSEVVILCTCNRLEIYTAAEDTAQAVESVTSYLSGRAAVPAGLLRDYLAIMTGEDAANHLMRVAAGLESLALGESEILGQVTGAMLRAQQAGTAGAVLSRLFQDAIHAGKRARSETAISQHTLSISHAAVLMAKRQIPDLNGANALVIGAGLMAELALRALKAHGAAAIRVMNRTFPRAQTLANRHNVEAVEWDVLKSALRTADIVVTATAAPHPVLIAGDIADAENSTAARPLVVLDIAMPRNVEQRVGDLPGVSLYDLDSLQAVVDTHRARRQSEIQRVEAIINDELTAYIGWLNSRSAVSTIVALRQKAETLAAAELERTLNRLPELSEQEQAVIAQMAHRIVNKLMHAPTTSLRDRTAEGDHYTYIHATRQLFDLEDEANRE
jgi:glutamyl-tRNA reductase